MIAFQPTSNDYSLSTTLAFHWSYHHRTRHSQPPTGVYSISRNLSMGDGCSNPTDDSMWCSSFNHRSITIEWQEIKVRCRGDHGKQAVGEACSIMLGFRDHDHIEVLVIHGRLVPEFECFWIIYECFTGLYNDRASVIVYRWSCFWLPLQPAYLQAQWCLLFSLQHKEQSVI